MESLFQSFAEARKLRQSARAALIKSVVQTRQQRRAELRSQAESLNQLLSAAQQQRLLSNRHRLIVANLHQRNRRADSSARSQAVDSQLAERQNWRRNSAIADQQARQQQFSQRATALQQFLTDLHRQRLANSCASQQLRQSDRCNRLQNLRSQLRQVRLHRRHISDLSKSQRQQQYHALATSIQQLLRQIRGDRHRRAVLLRQHLNAFRQQLARQVGVVHIRQSIAPKALAPAKPAPPVSSPEQFIRQYISQLPHRPTLGQVVNDRDLVRDILAQGANQLKVDPSDILSTLLRMASTE